MFVIDLISKWSGKLFGFIAIVVMGVIAYEVVARYAFNSPTIWANEASTYLSGIYYVMGGAYSLFLKGHVNVDVIYGRFNPRTRAIIDVATFPFFFLWFGAIIWTSGDFAWTSLAIRETTGSAWSPPIYPVKATIPLASFLLLLQGFAKFARDIKCFSQRDE